MRGEERCVPMPGLLAARAAGKLLEILGSGTAAAISPVWGLPFRGAAPMIHRGRAGDRTQRLFGTLTGIRHGKMEHPFGWMTPVSPRGFGPSVGDGRGSLRDGGKEARR